MYETNESLSFRRTEFDLSTNEMTLLEIGNFAITDIQNYVIFDSFTGKMAHPLRSSQLNFNLEKETKKIGLIL